MHKGSPGDIWLYRDEHPPILERHFLLLERIGKHQFEYWRAIELELGRATKIVLSAPADADLWKKIA